MLRHYPLSILCFIAVVYLSLMRVPETPLAEIRFIDKWTHIIMYLGLSGTIWFEYLRQHGLRFAPKPHGLRHQELSMRDLVCYDFIPSALLGGLLEILQETCTNHTRSGDWIDFLADAFGVLVSWLIYKAVLRYI